MDGYHLHVSIPRTEAQTKAGGLKKYTAYFIQVDDCGKVYVRERRFSSFDWLHGELRKRELACALPELPPKKAVGKFEATFVERRRQMLEEYLVALLKLPAVIQDDMIWTFLDADLPTAVVPRFLCRPASCTAMHDLLVHLDKVVRAPNQANLFRFYSPALTGAPAPVPAALVAFTRSEANEPVQDLGPQSQQVQQARLSSRQRICAILQVLFAHEGCRQALVDAGMFGALLDLLRRATVDAEAAAADPGSRSSDSGDPHRKTTYLLNVALSQLLEASKGAALLHFCQHDDGLNALHRLATSDVALLHPVVASLLWNGLRSPGVASVLVSMPATTADAPKGLRLLGTLLRSADPRARLLSALSVACLVREEGLLDAAYRDFCMEALATVPHDLDAAENEAVQKAAFAGVRRGADAGAQSGDAAADVEDATSVGSAVHRERIHGLTSLLRTLCSEREILRLKVLLGDPAAGFDNATSLVIAVLDHFARQCQEPAKLAEISILAPELQRFLRLDLAVAEDWSLGEGPPPAIHCLDAMRIARLLVRLDRWSSSVGGEEGNGEPPSILELDKRSRVLHLLTAHSEATQEEAAERFVMSESRGQRQGSRVVDGHLTAAPCVTEARLSEMAKDLRSIYECRGTLAWQLGVSLRASDAGRERLERRRMKGSILHTEVEDVTRKIRQQAQQEFRSDEARQRVLECEEQSHVANVEYEAAHARVTEAATYAEESERALRDAEARTGMLAAREQELAELIHNAPAQMERAAAKLDELALQQQKLIERRQRMSQEAEHTDRRSTALRHAEREADDALQKVSTLKARLDAFQQTLQSELVLTDEQLGQLRQLEFALQPPRPSRLRKSKMVADPETAVGDAEDHTALGERCCENTADAPNWDDERNAEQEVRTNLHFRSFHKLCLERERLWRAERVWLQDVAGRVEAATGQLATERQNLEAEERRIAEEAESHRREQGELADHDGHARRHAEARNKAVEARESVDGAAARSAEAVGYKRQAEVALEKCDVDLRKTELALASAREAEAREATLSARARCELDKSIAELEVRMRTHVDEWTAVELQERQIHLWQQSVHEQLASETEARHMVRQNAQQLIGLLHELVRQLDDPPDDIG